jgi:spore maturation protein B
MSEYLSFISEMFLPCLITVILVYGWIKKVNVYNLFIEGCQEGLKTAADILPFIIAVFLAITLMVDSGAISIVEKICDPVFSLFGIPEELAAFLIMRPVSGSGTLVILEQLADEFGADSFLCRSACVMMGSSETLLYAIAVYFGVTSVKRMKHTVVAGIIGYIMGIWLSLVLCRMM